MNALRKAGTARHLFLAMIGLILLAGCNHSDALTAQTSASTAPTSRPFQDPREAAILVNPIQLTRNFDRAGEAYFSADMKYIIFQASPHGQPHYQMYVAPLIYENGRISGAGEPTRISPENSRNTCGFFSPDGRSILFASTAGKEVPDEKEGGYQREGRDYRWSFPAGMEIYRCDDWQRALILSHTDTPNGPITISAHLARPALTDNNVYDAECAFSPDGKWICFTSMRTGDGDIYVMRSDGSHVVQITDAPGYDGGPFFSPDGKRLVYRSDRQKNNLLQVFVADLAFDADGNITGKSAERQLTHDVNVNWCPFWHPDGKHLIYATSKEGHANYELFAMHDDGSHETRITYTPGPDILPVFSPDGQYMMWTCKRSPDNTTQIFVAKFVPPAGW
ncbi:MAG TPA: hypothetical protein VH370_15205 [Humisphaera sp.]|jgi:Tol biopolymer transport system component|nr:hypothetical protein [Humisphaera sp.]